LTPSIREPWRTSCTRPRRRRCQARFCLLRVLRALARPNVRRITFAGSDQPARWRKLFDEEFIPQPFVELMEALNRVQTATGMFFSIGPGFTSADVANIHLADTLLRGPPYPQTWERARLDLVIPEDDAGAPATQPASRVTRSALTFRPGHDSGTGETCHRWRGRPARLSRSRPGHGSGPRRAQGQRSTSPSRWCRAVARG
jgi:hypothetical protein